MKQSVCCSLALAVALLSTALLLPAHADPLDAMISVEEGDVVDVTLAGLGGPRITLEDSPTPSGSPEPSPEPSAGPGSRKLLQVARLDATVTVEEGDLVDVSLAGLGGPRITLEDPPMPSGSPEPSAEPGSRKLLQVSK